MTAWIRTALLALCLALAASPALAADAPKKGDKVEKKKDESPYTCPMHPDVDHAGPGACPKCGMDLVPREPKK